MNLQTTLLYKITIQLCNTPGTIPQGAEGYDQGRPEPARALKHRFMLAMPCSRQVVVFAGGARGNERLKGRKD